MNDHERDFFNRRRRFLGGLGALGALGLATLSRPRIAGATESDTIELPFANGTRMLTSSFPQKKDVILLRTRPPLLETPYEVFDSGVLTPNDRFFVRWHLANIPTSVAPSTYRLGIRGCVEKTVSLKLDDLLTKFDRHEITAVAQCAGNSRGLFDPRVPGAQWAHGAMGNARWTGVRLKDLLDYAGVRSNAVQVRFKGLDTGVVPQTPQLMKSLDIDHARDGEVMVAYAMNGEPLPYLNGYPIRLIVPGWFATYWIKMLADIEVLDRPDDRFWTAKAYRTPATPHSSVHPGDKGFKTVPVSTMVPRSFITSVRNGATLPAGQSTLVRGIAFGGLHGLKRVAFSDDGGRMWRETQLGQDHGKYSFRQWQATLSPSTRGSRVLMARAIDTTGQMQPLEPNWNGSGFLRNVVETVTVHLA
ncbi:molybdopterin-dependent oxidoreductase [Burkholderia ambifaria]|uniref:Oxidoreductase molybdopterin binding n=1 Tax=Burkholderia ambifaria MEX-5 TaxID=396597 RepID=B1T1F7_9BURK|nr:molybdopterin-dependent oxidoreductase [Burkholderia ambifaria]EDT42590.1 oxidoreductase molybdopterin binding [Burkholderia ambifaria MEX-5]